MKVESRTNFLPVKICESLTFAEFSIGRSKGKSWTHVNGDKVDLGVTVLPGLGGGHVDDLAGTACK